MTPPASSGPVEEQQEAVREVRWRVIRALWHARDAHGGVPFDRKDVWRQGYDVACRTVIRELDASLSRVPASGDQPAERG